MFTEDKDMEQYKIGEHTVAIMKHDPARIPRKRDVE